MKISCILNTPAFSLVSYSCLLLLLLLLFLHLHVHNRCPVVITGAESQQVFSTLLQIIQYLHRPLTTPLSGQSELFFKFTLHSILKEVFYCTILSAPIILVTILISMFQTFIFFLFPVKFLVIIICSTNSFRFLKANVFQESYK